MVDANFAENRCYKRPHLLTRAELLSVYDLFADGFATTTLQINGRPLAGRGELETMPFIEDVASFSFSGSKGAAYARINWSAERAELQLFGEAIAPLRALALLANALFGAPAKVAPTATAPGGAMPASRAIIAVSVALAALCLPFGF